MEDLDAEAVENMRKLIADKQEVLKNEKNAN
jgi:hypothetical protein